MSWLWWGGYVEYKNMMTPEETPVDFHKSQLAQAILDGDVDELRLVLETKGGIELLDCHQNTLIHYAVECDKEAILDVLLATEDAPIDECNETGETALLRAAMKSTEPIISRLAEIVADVNADGPAGVTPLGYAIRRSLNPSAKLLIEKGANVHGDLRGPTPLQLACKFNNIEGVHLLLDHGADPNVPTRDGYPPFLYANHEAQAILFDRVFDGNKRPVLVNILTKAMSTDSPLLEKLFENVTRVYYYEKDLQELSQEIFKMNPEYFKIFVQRFEHAGRKIISQATLLADLLAAGDARGVENMQTLLDSQLKYVIRNINAHSLLEIPFGKYLRLGDFIRGFSKIDQSLHDSLLDIATQLVSKWARFDADCLCFVYRKYGFSPLFKKMIVSNSALDCQKKINQVMPRLIVDVSTTLHDFLKNDRGISRHIELTLEHFRDTRLREFFVRFFTEIRAKEQKPQVPLLLELARNVARKHIVTFYRVRTFREFSHLLDRLPITKEAERVLTYETKLYEVEPW